jgi:hypothetical protein
MPAGSLFRWKIIYKAQATDICHVKYSPDNTYSKVIKAEIPRGI